MGRFTGTNAADTISPGLVSQGVIRVPENSTPSASADTIDGRGGNDILDGGDGADVIAGGDGNDTISVSGAGSVVHGNDGRDEITIAPVGILSPQVAEPDAFPLGRNLTSAFPGATLSVTGEPNTVVTAANGIIDDPGPGAPAGPHNFATTGTVLFGQDPADAPSGGWGQGLPLWNADEFGQLRVDFARPTDKVSIDFAFDDDDVGRLAAYGEGGELLQAVTGTGRGPETFTGTIARDTPDISYITAGGVDREALYLDNLRYNLAASTMDVSTTVYGDAGDDQLRFAFTTEDPVALAGTVSLHGGDGNDQIAVCADSYFAAESIDFGTTRFEQYGEAGDDTLHAMYNFYVETGNYGAADDYLYGGPGNDTYTLEEGADVVVEKAGEGYDTVIGIADDYILAANVEKLILADSSDASVGGLRGTGNTLANTIVGTQANDTLDGAAGNDTLYGKPLGENWDGNGDADTIHGGSGNDLIYGAGGDKDTWDGDDLLYGDDGNDRIFGSYGDDRMYGGTGADELGGQAGNDTMYGGTGKDKLGGGSGDDWLYGEADADVLSGRGGLDRLSGGPGNDIFDYDAATDSKGALRDVILDFAGAGAAVGDRVDLATIDANTTAGGNQAFKFIGKAGFSGPGQVRVAASGADTLIQVNTDANKATVEMDILVKDGAATPTQWVAGDFIL